jgi:chemotaxis protein histidine kinase CheA
MAKKNTTKKAASKKKPAAKKSAPKKAVPKKEETPVVEETPVAPPVEEPATEPEEDLSTTETDEAEGEADVPAAHPDPEPEPEENVKSAPVEVNAEDVGWRYRLVEEATELRGRMKKLRAAIDERKVPLDQVPILNEQYQAMHALYVILNRRLSNS